MDHSLFCIDYRYLRKMKRRSSRIKSCEPELEPELEPTASKPKPRYECAVCNKSYSRIDTLREHKRIVHGHDWYECTLCFYEFGKLDALKKHEREAHGDNLVTCNICDAKFSAPRHLHRHQATTHNDECPYKCAICSKSFKRADSLKLHESTVHGEPGEEIFIARQCSKCLSAHRLHHHVVFSRGKDGNLRSHHQCLVCFEVNQWCDSYGMHYDNHSLEEIPKSKAFQCERCYKLFASKKTLGKHSCMVDAKDEPKEFSVSAHPVSYL